MRAFQAAAVARGRSVWNAAQVHEVGSVPASPRIPYNVVSVSAGGADNHRGDGSHGSTARRVIVQCVGRTVAEVGFAVEKADVAYQDHRLAVAGYDTTPASTELAANVYRDPDGGSLLMVTQTYEFHAYPTA